MDGRRLVSRVKVEMRWPVEVRDTVDVQARGLGLTRTEFVLRELGYGEPRQDVDRAARIESLRAEIAVREPKRVSPKDCPHPRDQRKVLSYMTKCDACGGRLS